MTKRHRTILFLVLALLFVLAAPAIALYSQGYQLDWENKRITQTGAFFVRAEPNRVHVFLDGELAKVTDFFFGSVRTQNLLPGSYLVRLEKEGYAPWEKRLEVTEKMVTEVNAALFPEQVDFRAIESDVENIWPSPDRKKVLLQETGLYNIPQLRLWDISAGRQTVLWKASSPQVSIEYAEWAHDSERILLQFAEQETLHSGVLHIPSSRSSACRQQLCSLSFIPLLNTERLQFSPHENKVVVLRLLRDGQILQEADYAEQRMGSFWGKDVVSFTVSGDRVYWLEQEGIAYSTNVQSPSPQQLHSEPISVEQEIQHTLLLVNGSVFIKRGNQLYLLRNNAFGEIGGFVHELAGSPDGTKLALSNNSELLLYILASQENRQPKRNAGDSVFLTRLSDRLSSPTWIDSSYLVFGAGNRIIITETDTRDRINSVELASFPNPKFFWQPDEKSIYVFSKDTLYASQKLIR